MQGLKADGNYFGEPASLWWKIEWKVKENINGLSKV